MHKITNQIINCRIQVEVSHDKWIWLDGYIKSINKDGTCWIRVPKTDDLYLCDEDEIWANFGDIREYYKEAIL